MTFVVNAIKQDFQDSQKSLNIKILLDIDSQLFARKFMESSGLVLLSLNEYSSPVESFGAFYVLVPFENQQIRIVGSKEMSLKSLCSIFVSLGFVPTAGDSFVEPQGPQQFAKILDFCTKEFQSQLASEQLSQQQQQEKKLYYQNDGLEKAKQVIVWALDKVDSLLLEKGAFISAKDLRLIKENVEELKKLRMGTNYEKTRDMLQELFSLVDRVEEDYYASLEANSSVLFPTTVVREVDVERQISIVEKISQQQQFGGSVATNRKDYVVFGSSFVYLLFIKRDFSAVFQNLLSSVYKIFDLLQIGFLMTIIVLAISVLYYILFLPTYSLGSFYMAFCSLGFLGVLSFCFSLLKAKNPLLVALLLVVMFVVYFVGFPLLKHTFVLS